MRARDRKALSVALRDQSALEQEARAKSIFDDDTYVCCVRIPSELARQPNENRAQHRARLKREQKARRNQR